MTYPTFLTRPVPGSDRLGRFAARRPLVLIVAGFTAGAASMVASVLIWR